MPASTAPGLLQTITAAVTPVVMISASAALILGINQKHAALAERMRTLAVEFRAPATEAERRGVIRAEMQLFTRRIFCVGLAHLWLYLALLCFVAMVPVITLATRSGGWDRAAFCLFVAGITLVLGAVLAELTELRLAGCTIQLDVADILSAPTPAGSGERGRGKGTAR